MKGILFVVALALPASAAELQKTLETMAAGHRGKVAVFAKNLKSGATVAVRADEPVKTASVIKLPIMLEVFHQVKAGKRSLGDKIALKKDDQVLGSGVLPYLRPGLELTLEDAVTLMMIVSDNTATNLVIDQAGVEAVNARIAALGLKDTHLYKKIGRPATSAMPPDQKKFGLGKTTAREMAAVLEAVARCELGDDKLCGRMLEMMRAEQYRAMIPRYLETVDWTEVPTAIASKYGALDDVRNDVALVWSKAGPIVISIFTWENQDQSWTPENEAEVLIGRMAKAIVEEWSPQGLEPPKQ